MDERQFRMKCPKCRSYSFTVRRDQRAYVHKSQPFELVFSCRCGKQLFGEQIQKEYDRQKALYDAGGGLEEVEPEPEVDPELLERRREEERRKEQLRRAMEYRRKYLAEKRKQQSEEERRKKEDEDRRWREKVALVGEPSKKSPTTSAKAAASGAMGSRVRPTPPKPKPPPPPAPKPPPRAPKPVAVAAPAPKAVLPSPATLDPEHPHAEFMPYLAEGTFSTFFPDAITPDQKDPALCVWPTCEKPRRKKSKYCSRECSNKNARWRHKQRKKG